MGLDTKTHNLFLDTAEFAPPAAPTAGPAPSAANGRSGIVPRVGLWAVKIVNCAESQMGTSIGASFNAKQRGVIPLRAGLLRGFSIVNINKHVDVCRV